MKTKEKWKSLESKQRFSLRKLSIGVCSVALSIVAISITSINNSLVKADTVSTENVAKSQVVTETKSNNSVNQANVTNNTISSISPQKTTTSVVPNEVKQNNNKVTSLSVNTAKITENNNSQGVNNDQRAKFDVSNTKNIKKVPGVKSYNHASSVPQWGNPNSWQTYNNNWYYYDNYGILSRNTGSWIGNNLFYFNNDGSAAKNAWKQGGNNWYYFGNDGHAYRNRGAWLSSNLFYFNNDGSAAKSAWKQGGNNWYYFGNDGHAYRNTGAWLSGNLFYFNNDGTAAKNAWKQGGNNWYYFGKDGHAYRNGGYYLDNNTFYYFDSDGKAFKDNYNPGGYFKVSIDSIASDISGYTNTNGYLWVKDQNGKWSFEKTFSVWKQDSKGTWYPIDKSFTFGGSKYAGQWITLQLRDGDKVNSKVISKSQTLYVPKLVIENMSVDSRSFNRGYVSGRVNGDGELWVKSQNGKWFKPERYRDEAVGSFGFDGIKYAGQWLTIEFRDSGSGRVISRPSKIYIPQF